MPISLRTALGRYPHTEALRSGRLSSPMFTLECEDITPVNRAFAPMVRELRFDVCEMAIATFLQALACDKPLVLLPVAVAARFQEPALICRADSDLTSPADLWGRRVGIRAYSQTTGLWLRGTLQEQFAIAPDAIEWVTFEGAHVSEYRDPPWVTRAPDGASLLGMLHERRLDAVIMGNDLPDDPELRPVFPDPAAASETFFKQHGFVPVNHLVCVRRDLATQQPEVILALMRLFRSALADQAGLPVGRAALAPAVALAIGYATEQGLLPRPVATADIWSGLPDDPVFD
jgi:4,5-dihydroxyphthalate decarboxylase